MNRDIFFNKYYKQKKKATVKPRTYDIINLIDALDVAGLSGSLEGDDYKILDKLTAQQATLLTKIIYKTRFELINKKERL